MKFLPNNYKTSPMEVVDKTTTLVLVWEVETLWMMVLMLDVLILNKKNVSLEVLVLI